MAIMVFEPVAEGIDATRILRELSELSSDIVGLMTSSCLDPWRVFLEFVYSSRRFSSSGLYNAVITVSGDSLTADDSILLPPFTVAGPVPVLPTLRTWKKTILMTREIYVRTINNGITVQLFLFDCH